MNINSGFQNVVQSLENACAGFALASVLPNATPLTIYSEIQQVQKSYQGTRSLFITGSAGMVKDKSKMSLPSAIVAVAINHKCAAKVFCNKSTLSVDPMFKDIYNDEINPIGANNVDQNTAAYKLPAKKGVVHIVLVNQGTHWVSVDNDGKDCHSYNPGNGGITTVKSIAKYAELFIELTATP
jgi:hypothetical protein